MLTLLEAANLALDYLEKVEVKGRENVCNLYKAQDAVFAIKLALEQANSKKEEKEGE